MRGARYKPPIGAIGERTATQKRNARKELIISGIVWVGTFIISVLILFWAHFLKYGEPFSWNMFWNVFCNNNTDLLSVVASMGLALCFQFVVIKRKNWLLILLFAMTIIVTVILYVVWSSCFILPLMNENHVLLKSLKQINHFAMIAMGGVALTSFVCMTFSS